MSVESMVSAQHLTAIEKLGVRLENTFTAEQAMTHGRLGGWDVRKVPLMADVSGIRVPVPGKMAVIRNSPVTRGRYDVLGDVGVNYQTIQNEEHVGLLNALVDESGANFELAGALEGGKRVFISMKLPGHITIGGVDRVENSIVAVNSHDGSMSFTLMVAPVRYACGNVLNCAFANRSHIFRIRHTSGAGKALVAQARAALDLTFDYLDDFQREAEQLINQTMTESRFEEIVTRAFGPEIGAAPAVVTRAEKKVEQMTQLFADAVTQTGIRETAWAGFNALTEWYDHFSPTRGDDRENARATKALLDPGFKNRALALMTR